MELLGIGYRDPLFGVILFLVIVLIVFFSNKIWKDYANAKKERSITRFMKRFDSSEIDEELKVLLDKGIEPIEPLKIIASIYQKSGEQEKAIKIYLALLENIESSRVKSEIMELLGKSYFDAGFMQRSKDIFLEILKNYPRNPLALRYLMLIYESMHDFEKGAEILEPLEVLGVDVSKEGRYFRIKQKIKSELLNGQNIKEIYQIAQNDPTLRRVCHSALLTQGQEESLIEHLLETDQKVSLDILWKIEDVKKLSQKKGEIGIINEILCAKGGQGDCEFSSFELSALNAINRYSKKKGVLDFEYICNECKQIYPLGFDRCPNCMALLEIEPLPIISRRRDDAENHSLL